MRVITSPHNPRVKLLRRLHERRHRARTGLTLVEGWRAVDGLCRARAPIRELWVAEGAEPPVAMASLEERLAGVPRTAVPWSVFRTFADTETPQGVVAVVEVATVSLEQLLARHPDGLFLIVDGVQDPGNGGALVRTAVAAGVAGIVTTPGTVDLYGPRALRGAAGLTPACPLAPDVPRRRIAAALAEAGVGVYVLDVAGARSPFDVDWRGGRALVAGAEGGGAGPEWGEAGAERLRIPMREPAESLNVAVSAGICLYEAARQRGAFAGGSGGQLVGGSGAVL